MGAVMKKKELVPMKEVLDWYWDWWWCWGVGRRNQVLEEGSKAKDWLFFEEMLWMPWRKNHGCLRWLERVEKEEEEIMECHSLQTVEALIKVGIGRRDRISSMRSVLRKYRLRLNPAKCTFGVKLGKLLGFIVG